MQPNLKRYIHAKRLYLSRLEQHGDHIWLQLYASNKRSITLFDIVFFDTTSEFKFVKISEPKTLATVLQFRRLEESFNEKNVVEITFNKETKKNTLKIAFVEHAYYKKTMWVRTKK